MPSPGPQPHRLFLALGSRHWLHTWSLTPKGQHRVPGKVLGPTAQRGFITLVRICLHPPTDTQHWSWQSICSLGASTASGLPRAQALPAFLPAEEEALSPSIMASSVGEPIHPQSHGHPYFSMVFPSPARPSLPWCVPSFLSMVIPSLTLSSLPQHCHPSLRMVTVSSWFDSCLVPEGETPGDATGFPMLRSHPQSLKPNTAGEVHREEFALSFPDPLYIFPLISSPTKLRCYSSAPPHPSHACIG